MGSSGVGEGCLPSRTATLPAVCNPYAKKAIIAPSPLKENNASEGKLSNGGDAPVAKELPQLDLEAARKWVYPTNMPVRSYQVDIVNTALFANTLVCLPTGLGKTLIAAVVMANFYRWYPTGQVVFMAPTKPLVAQQVQACHDIMGISAAVTAELQGSVPPAQRKLLWASRNIIYCTPQSFVNDVSSGACDASRVVCVVVDEAHRATGKYAYCMAVKWIARATPAFRILALSATPGSNAEAIQEVFSNLRIARIECRDESDPDVRKHTHDRKLEIIKCVLTDELQALRDAIVAVMQPILLRLVKLGVYHSANAKDLHPYQIITARERFQHHPENTRASVCEFKLIESELSLLSKFASWKNSAMTHGMGDMAGKIALMQRDIQSASHNSPAVRQLRGCQAWADLVTLVHSMNRVAVSGEDEKRTVQHAKLEKLRDVLVDHFKQHGAEGKTRAIIFTQFRASVEEIVAYLANEEGLSLARFVGQSTTAKRKKVAGDGDDDNFGYNGDELTENDAPGKVVQQGTNSGKGLTQVEQKAVLAKFRRGEFNCLVATCIAEEGLDIGDVDLIVSYDMLSSPVRMVQRMGRTGRKRAGRVVMLVTEGVEESKLKASNQKTKRVAKLLQQPGKFELYSDLSPRMVPSELEPVMEEQHISVGEFRLSQLGGSRRRGGVKKDLSESCESKWASWRLTHEERRRLKEQYSGGSEHLLPPDFMGGYRRQACPRRVDFVDHCALTTGILNFSCFVRNREWDVLYKVSGTSTTKRLGSEQIRRLCSPSSASPAADITIGSGFGARRQAMGTHQRAGLENLPLRDQTPSSPDASGDNRISLAQVVQGNSSLRGASALESCANISKSAWNLGVCALEEQTPLTPAANLYHSDAGDCGGEDRSSHPEVTCVVVDTMSPATAENVRCNSHPEKNGRDADGHRTVLSDVRDSGATLHTSNKFCDSRFGDPSNNQAVAKDHSEAVPGNEEPPASCNGDLVIIISNPAFGTDELLPKDNSVGVTKQAVKSQFSQGAVPAQRSPASSGNAHSRGESVTDKSSSCVSRDRGRVGVKRRRPCNYYEKSLSLKQSTRFPTVGALFRAKNIDANDRSSLLASAMGVECDDMGYSAPVPTPPIAASAAAPPGTGQSPNLCAVESQLPSPSGPVAGTASPTSSPLPDSASHTEDFSHSSQLGNDARSCPDLDEVPHCWSGSYDNLSHCDEVDVSHPDECGTVQQSSGRESLESVLHSHADMVEPRLGGPVALESPDIVGLGQPDLETPIGRRPKAKSRILHSDSSLFADTPASQNNAHRRKILRRKTRRSQESVKAKKPRKQTHVDAGLLAALVDTEAVVDESDISDDDEDALDALYGASQDSFINDGSISCSATQTQSQVSDAASPSALRDSGLGFYRNVDAQHSSPDTPAFRFARGRMKFVGAVAQYAKEGGEPLDVEMMCKTGSFSCDSHASPSPSQNMPQQAAECMPQATPVAAVTGLSEEQRRRVELNKQIALQKLSRKTALQSAASTLPAVGAPSPPDFSHDTGGRDPGFNFDIDFGSEDDDDGRNHDKAVCAADPPAIETEPEYRERFNALGGTFVLMLPEHKTSPLPSRVHEVLINACPVPVRRGSLENEADLLVGAQCALCVLSGDEFSPNSLLLRMKRLKLLYREVVALVIGGYAQSQGKLGGDLESFCIRFCATVSEAVLEIACISLAENSKGSSLPSKSHLSDLVPAVGNLLAELRSTEALAISCGAVECMAEAFRGKSLREVLSLSAGVVRRSVPGMDARQAGNVTRHLRKILTASRPSIPL